ncbi:Retrovirus-related Pol polyprotein from transposon RE1 [Bienertia sinuspersici]
MVDDNKIDPSSPFFLGAGDQPSNLITHVILKKGDNYLAWSRANALSLKSRRIFWFVYGTILKPIEKQKMLGWETVNSMLVSWILRAGKPKLAASIPYFEEAKKLWDYLAKRFCEANGPHLQQLRAYIIGSEQTKSMSVEDYYNTLMGLFDDLTRLKPPPPPPPMTISVDFVLVMLLLNMNWIGRRRNCINF